MTLSDTGRSNGQWVRRLAASVILGALSLTAGVARGDAIATTGTMTLNAFTNRADGGATYATLTTNPRIRETTPGEWEVAIPPATGSFIILTAPTGFEFDPGATYTATVTPGVGGVTLSAPVVTATTVTYTVTAASTSASTIEFSDIGLWATNCTNATAGTGKTITVRCTGGTTLNAAAGTALVNLTVTAGPASAYRVTTNPVILGVGRATRVTITAVDACGNAVANFDPSANIVFSTNTGGPGNNVTYANGTGAFVLTANVPGVGQATLDATGANTFDATGQFRFDLTNTVAEGPITITATGEFGANATDANNRVTWTSVSVVQDGAVAIVTGTDADEVIVVSIVTIGAGEYVSCEPPAPEGCEPIPEEDTQVLQVTVNGVDVFDLTTQAGFNAALRFGTDTGFTSIRIDALGGNDEIDATSPSLCPRQGQQGGQGEAVSVEINGGEGDDIIRGGCGNDKLNGDAGDDWIEGGDGNDTIKTGLPGDRCGKVDSPYFPYCDVADGQLGDDTIEGGAGNDKLTGGPEEPPPDTGGQGQSQQASDNDNIKGGPGDDYLIGGYGNDVLAGQDGNDRLYGGRGDDQLVGGGGLGDIADYSIADGSVTVNLPLGVADDGFGGTDALDSKSIEVILGSPNADVLIGRLDQPTTILGGADADTITGGDKADILFGEAGDDTIYAGAGIDVVYGGAGNDTVFGGADPDFIFGDGDPAPAFMIDTPEDEPLFRRRASTGQIVQPPALDPQTEVELPYILLPSGLAELTQKLVPGLARGDDILFGEGGADRIYGGAGSDLILGCADLEDGSGCDDDGADVIFGDWHIPTGTSINMGVITGGGADWIRGGPGGDIIMGGPGADHINGDDGADTLYGDYDYDFASSGAGHTTWGTTEDDGFYDANPNTLPSAASRDVLYGGGMADELFGGPGADTLIGGLGADLLQPDAGNDLVIGGDVLIALPVPGSEPDPNDPAGKIKEGIGFPENFPTLLSTPDSGFDTLNYSMAPYGVIVDLGRSSALNFSGLGGTGVGPKTIVDQCNGATHFAGYACNDGEGDPGPDGVFGTLDDIVVYSDRIAGVENVIGSDFDDVIFGTDDPAPTGFLLGSNFVPSVPRDQASGGSGGSLASSLPISNPANIILGRGGNDRIMGRGGEDALLGGEGNDVICGDEDLRCEACTTAEVLAGTCAPLIPNPQANLGSDDGISGGPGDDVIFANGGNDIVLGGTGADRLSGGPGTDTLSYSDSTSTRGVVINLRNVPVDLLELGQLAKSVGLPFDPDPDPTDPLLEPSRLTGLPQGPCSLGGTVQCGNTATDAGSRFPAVPRAIDTIVNAPVGSPEDRFEVIVGSSGNDVIYGHSSRPTQIIGGSGNDILIGGDNASGEKLYVGTGVTTDPYPYDNALWGDFVGGTGTSATRGGDDVLFSSSGDDYLDGGPESFLVNPPGNYVCYAKATAGVTVSLQDTQTQNTRGAGRDRILNFRHLIGSQHDDRLTGSRGNNRLIGLGGDDMLFGGPGNDILEGGQGTDTADYQSCLCVDPTLLSYDLAAGVVPNDGQGGVDQLLGIERVLVPPPPVSGGGGGGGAVPAPVTINAGPDQIIRAGGSIRLQAVAAGGIPPYAYVWDVFNTVGTPPANVTVIVDGDTPSPTMSPLVTTVFRVTVRDALNSVATDFVTVTVLPRLEVDAGQNRTIPPGVTVELTARVTGGQLPYSYLWTADLDGGFLSSVTQPRVTVQPTATTVYTCTVVDNIGTEVSDTVTVVVIATTPGTGTGGGTTGGTGGTGSTGGSTGGTTGGTTSGETGGTTTPTNGGTNTGTDGGTDTSQTPRASPPDRNQPTVAPFSCGIGAGLMGGSFVLLLLMKRRRFH